MAKVTILTQHLLDNYGGILQNFALQESIKCLGYDVETIDYLRTISFTPFHHYLLSWAKSLVFFFVPGKRRKFIRYSHKGVRRDWASDFVSKRINTSCRCFRYKASHLMDSDIVVVGSDQVWRPKYNYRIKDMFLNFCKHRKNIKRVAYAASFGVDDWEFTPRQTKSCSKLAQKFDAISVREESGVRLCKKYLGVDASWVLDPTLLLPKEKYCEICKDVPITRKKVLVAYVLDKSESVRELCENIAHERGLELKYFGIGTKKSPSIPEWLAMFRDASYVVTDSFHGTVFSIIFGKKFKCLYNENRGSARFNSLLKIYSSGQFDEMRKFSLKWLKNALEL